MRLGEQLSAVESVKLSMAEANLEARIEALRSETAKMHRDLEGRVMSCSAEGPERLGVQMSSVEQKLAELERADHRLTKQADDLRASWEQVQISSTEQKLAEL